MAKKHVDQLSPDFVRGYKAGLAAAKEDAHNETDDVDTFGVEEAALVARRHNGYFRFAASPDSTLWIRFKWTQGDLAGSYVFASDVSLGAALAKICTRIHDAESGKLKPHVDTGYRRSKSSG